MWNRQSKKRNAIPTINIDTRKAHRDMLLSYNMDGCVECIPVVYSREVGCEEGEGDAGQVERQALLGHRPRVAAEGVVHRAQKHASLRCGEEI